MSLVMVHYCADNDSEKAKMNIGIPERFRDRYIRYQALYKQRAEEEQLWPYNYTQSHNAEKMHDI